MGPSKESNLYTTIRHEIVTTAIA